MALSLPAKLIKLEFFLRRLVGQNAHDDFSRRYWEARYRWGGDSGKGSRGDIAARKADFVTSFCREHDITSLVELGSGDGVCASQIKVAQYLGLDLSQDAVQRARRRVPSPTHCFLAIAGDSPEAILAKVRSHYGGNLPQASLSMDVILHLVEDSVYEAYLKTLFAISARYIVVFSSDADGPDEVHVRHRAYARRFMADFPVRQIAAHGDGRSAHFKVFEKL
jgi:hypothetical protein